jgi:hypothetical protein
MRTPGELRHEWGAAALVFTFVLACTLFLQGRAARVDEATEVRHRQLEQFVRVAADPRAAATDLSSFDGLFAGHVVVGEDREWGCLLTLRPRAEVVR